MPVAMPFAADTFLVDMLAVPVVAASNEVVAHSLVAADQRHDSHSTVKKVKTRSLETGLLELEAIIAKRLFHVCSVLVLYF